LQTGIIAAIVGVTAEKFDGETGAVQTADMVAQFR
jgi:hypothetical protein